MTSKRIIRRVGTAALTGLAIITTSGAAYAAPQPQLMARDITVQIANAPCDPEGTTSTDAALANRLNSSLTGNLSGAMTTYRVSCARMVVKAVRNRGLPERAAVIAITTTIVESGIQNHSEAVDHTSLGLFQQQDPWGSAEHRLDPIWATNAFLDKMIGLYRNNSWQTAPVGEVCQAVQVSGYPERYQPQAADAQKIVDTVWDYALNRDGLRSSASFSGDARSDLMVLETNGNLSARINMGTYFDGGRVVSAQWSNFLGNPGQGKLYFSDFNGDGRDDLMVLETNGNLSARINTGTYYDGGRVVSAQWSNFLGNPGQGKLYFSDFNGDGRDDLMVLETNGNLSARINTGTYYDGGRVVSAQWSNFLGNPGQGKLYFA